jgi:hypothetical protein
MSVRILPWADEVSGTSNIVTHSARNPETMAQAKNRSPLKRAIRVVFVFVIAQPQSITPF